MAKSVVTCPRLDHVNIPISYFFTHGLEVDYLYPPPITKRTWELGSNSSSFPPPPAHSVIPLLSLSPQRSRMQAGAPCL